MIHSLSTHICPSDALVLDFTWRDVFFNDYRASFICRICLCEEFLLSELNIW
jgi:hypothetical protein